MQILSTLRHRLSQVFAASQERDEDSAPESTQTTGSNDHGSNVRNSITFVENAGPGGEATTERGNNEAGSSNTGSVTLSQIYDDEEWARELCEEEIREAFTTPTRHIRNLFPEESEREESVVSMPKDAKSSKPLSKVQQATGSTNSTPAASTSRASLKRAAASDGHENNERTPKRLRVEKEFVQYEESGPAGHPFDGNIVADPDYFLDSGVAWAIKWEFTRLSARREIKVTPELLANLQGSHTRVAASLRRIVNPPNLDGASSSKSMHPWHARELAVTAPWEELDREDKAWEEGNDEGIGLKAKDGWYGGKVQFSTTLTWDKSRRQFEMQLNAPTLGKSTHFGRAFHSHSCITVRIAKDALKHPDLKVYLKQRHRFFGRDFYVLDASTEKVTLVDSKARRPRHNPATERPEEAQGIRWMLNYLNPMDQNMTQSVSKWRARFQLYFSDTVPGFRLPYDRLEEQDDIELPHGPGKCPAEKVLTDGCGRISAEALKSIQVNLKLERPMSAVQIRFYGAKGMALSMLPPGYEDPLPKDVVLRPSQIKIQHDQRYRYDEAKLTIDIVRPAKVSVPARLSAETIQILSHNGVPTSVFLDLQKKCFEEDFGAFTDWPEDKPLVKLAHAIAQTQNIVGSRRNRLVRGMARARGLSARSWDEVDEVQDEMEQEAEPQSSTAWWPDDTSGCPSSLAETCLVALQAGFRPESLPYLCRKIRNLLDDSLTRYVDKFKITVPQALTGTIVPDPLGILEPDEISISLSEPMEINGKKMMILKGPCLILRNPAKQETDVRKVTIVDRPRLHQLKDVIVISVKNKDRSLASRLGGGDYDGDKAQIILEDALIKPFRNAPTDVALDVPESVKNAFRSENGSVADLLTEENRNPANFAARLSDILLLPLNVYPGEYSIFHELSVYKHGLGHPESIRLGYMFTEGLDGSKTGKSVRPDVIQVDARRYRKYGRVPWNRSRKPAKPNSDTSNEVRPAVIVRDKELKPFVMDLIRSAGEHLIRETLKNFDKRIERNPKWRLDQTTEIKKWARACRDELKPRKDHDTGKILGKLIDVTDIDRILEVKRDTRPLDHWLQAINRATKWYINKENQGYAADLLHIYSTLAPIAAKHRTITGSRFTSLDIVTRQNALRRLSVEFAEAVSLDDLLTPMSRQELALLKASCAYSLCPRHVGVTDQFAFSVATRELCYLKAIDRPCQTISQEFIDGMSLHSGYVDDFE